MTCAETFALLNLHMLAARERNHIYLNQCPHKNLRAGEGEWEGPSEDLWILTLLPHVTFQGTIRTWNVPKSASSLNSLQERQYISNVLLKY